MRGAAAIAIIVLLAGCVAQPEDARPAAAVASGADGDCLRMLGGIDLQSATIADMQRALDAGEITSVQLVDAYVARIEAYDNAGPALNSVQLLDPAAREKAAILDAERAAGIVRGPLHGIPVLLKDNIDTFDMPNTAGSTALAGNVPIGDATLTAKLRAEGAIVLGKAQLSEFAHWRALMAPNGWSSLGGQVVNAYTGGDPSGSSSGSGVAASMAFAAAAIGTETSGSILSPSNANSVVGVKPTTGLVSRTGVIPIAASFDTPGPMTRNVYDAAVVLGAIAGPDPADARTAASAQHLPPAGDYTALLAPDALQGVRLGYVERDAKAYADALASLEALGAELVPVEQEDAEIVSLSEIALLFNEFKFGLNEYLATRAGPDTAVADLTAIVVHNEQHPETNQHGQDLLISSDATPGVWALSELALLPVLAVNQRVADDFFARHDVAAIVGPDAPFTGLGAAAGYPTVTVPMAYQQKEPVGLSFFGPAWSEPQLLAYAYAYEQATLARKTPTDVNPSLLSGVCGDGPAFQRVEIRAPPRGLI